MAKPYSEENNPLIGFSLVSLSSEKESLKPPSEYQAVFISPHVDDVVLSCGGTIAHSLKEGPVLVVNVFSQSGKTTPARKREEEEASRVLGYEYAFLDLPELTQRTLCGNFPHRMHRFLNNKGDRKWVQEIGKAIRGCLVSTKYERIYFPLGVGMHVDHGICFRAGLEWPDSQKTYFYEDVPYTLAPGTLENRLYYLTGKLSSILGRKSIFHLNDKLNSLLGFMLSRPCFEKITFSPIRQGIRYGMRAFFKHRIKQVLARKGADFTLLLKPLTVDMGEFFEKKLEGIYKYKSQVSDFFNSQQEAQRLLGDYHDISENGSRKSYERFWKIIP